MNGLGISGRVAGRFQDSAITPLLALAGLLLGLFAVLITPREEEPQINVTFANVFIPFPGASVKEVENLVTTPAEQVLSEIEGVKHIYSVTRPGMAVITVRFKVGEDRTQAIVRLYNQIYSHQDWLPPNLGVGQPIIKPRGIDDVPVITATLWTKDPAMGAHELGLVAHALEAELKRIPGTRDIYTIGAPQHLVRLLLDPQALAGYGIDLDDLRLALQASNQIRDGLTLTADNREIQVQAGTLLSKVEDIGGLVVGVRQGKPIFLRDVAEVKAGPGTPEQYVWLGTGPAAHGKGIAGKGRFPAVTLAVAKKPGINAVDIAQQVTERLEGLRGLLIPDNVEITVTRNYGATADAKARHLIQKLIFATLSVVVLVLLTLGWREALVVGAAVVITLAVTLFASWAWGFTINRVSLFALIFSIGILVDDAIVVVENIHRHLQTGASNLREAIPKAVDEVGGPTILATFTVIAALLPMAFVSGLMGPYMSPIPINASMGMLISLVVAFVFSPWLTRKVLSGHSHPAPAQGATVDAGLQRIFNGVIGPFLDERKGGRRRWLLLLGILLLIGLSVSLAINKWVVLKMLPFDNKSEFQVVLDMPEGTSLEQTTAVLDEMGAYLETVAEVTDYQVYAGSAAPIGFNGLVRQYYLRRAAHLGDIQVNLTDKGQRERQSHQVARAVRPALAAIGLKHGGRVKVVEVPPGPPVLAPLVAEVYGPDYGGQTEVAARVREALSTTADVVDLDDSIEAQADKWILMVDRQKAALLGVAQGEVARAVATLLEGDDVSFLHSENLKYAVPIRLVLPAMAQGDLDQVLALRVRAQSGALVPLSEIVQIVQSSREQAIHHKDLLPVVYVTADMAGRLDSPLYGMFEASERLGKEEGLSQFFLSQPPSPYAYGLKWDGEWQITFETFRDMGAAYAVGLVLIYLLVVAQFRSYGVPLVIMAPIPLTIIGILPGHALFGVQFTATSMIGMIALAGIIVRNSILLVDFINQELVAGSDFRQAVTRSAAVRAKPIMLTGIAAMAGAFFILDDPIFSGLAVSLISGIFVSTLLTLVVIPVVYYATRRQRIHTATD